jgi:cystathionine beta-lyase/cystathionine gamma-synthase
MAKHTGTITKDWSTKSFETRAVHAGERAPAPDATPVTSPIWPAVSYAYEDMDEADAMLGGTKPGPVYLRYGSPTVSAFETAMAALEGTEAAQATSSGMAAIHAGLLAAGAKAGAAVVAAMDVYGATYTLVGKLLATMGVQVRWVDVVNLEEVRTALTETHATILLVETLSNPLLKVADVPTLAGMAHQAGASLLVDNTFASPYLFTPAACGTDYVIHSATKYLSGHGDVLAGVAAVSAENKKKLYELNKLVGGVLGPFEAWLALRGLKTLPLRMRQQCQNAQKVAEWLQAHPRVSKVNYPGLANHPQHAQAKQLFAGKGFGGVLSFEIGGADKAGVFRFMEALRLCLPATSLGDIYSLVLYPLISSHRSLTPEERARVGIPDNLLRLSVGIEAVEDILADLEGALVKMG